MSRVIVKKFLIGFDNIYNILFLFICIIIIFLPIIFPLRLYFSYISYSILVACVYIIKYKHIKFISYNQINTHILTL